VDADGRRRSGSVWLDPPAIGGAVRHDDGTSSPIGGHVVGRRENLLEMGDRLITMATLPGLRKVVHAVADAALEPFAPPWAQLSLQFDSHRTVIDLVGDTWRPQSAVVQLDQRLLPWLRDFLAHTARRLAAHATTIASVETAWEVARLHLVLSEPAGTEQAVRRGIGLLRQSGLSAEAERTGRELAGVLDTVNGLQEVAAELRTALATAD
jgi:hypothetical protein